VPQVTDVVVQNVIAWMWTGWTPRSIAGCPDVRSFDGNAQRLHKSVPNMKWAALARSKFELAIRLMMV
jgi:hypothetical protein